MSNYDFCTQRACIHNDQFEDKDQRSHSGIPVVNLRKKAALTRASPNPGITAMHPDHCHHMYRTYKNQQMCPPKIYVINVMYKVQDVCLQLQ